jgi:hypothetical protein
MDEDQNNQNEPDPLLLQILRWLTDPRRRTLVTSPADEDQPRDKRSELAENGYITNDLVEVSSGFNYPEWYLKINGARTIRLTKAEFVLFLILVAHGQCLRRISAPLGAKFLSAQDILHLVGAWRKVEPRLTGFRSKEEVHRTVYELRDKIEESGASEKIIESGPRGEGGYRLSTSPFNVALL